MEAMASGLPAVAVTAGAIPELVKDDENGYLCEADNDEMVANYLIKILSDDELRKKLSKNAVEMIQRHDLNYTLTRFEDIYKTVLEKYHS